MSRYLWISICFGLPLFLLAGCLGQKQVDRSPDLSHLLTPEEAAAAKAKAEEEKKNALALLNSIRDARAKGGSLTPVDCEALCPPEPEEFCPEPTPTPSPEVSSTTALVIAPPVCAPQLLAKKLEDLLSPPVTPSSVHVFQDHAGNLIFSMLSAADISGNKYIYYAVLAADGTVIDWMPLYSGNTDEYAISTSATSNKLHVVARPSGGTVLMYCIFEVGLQCRRDDEPAWNPITFNRVNGVTTEDVSVQTGVIQGGLFNGFPIYGNQTRPVAEPRNILSAIKEGSLNLFEVPDVGVGLGFLGIPHTQDTANPPSTDGGYWFLETVYAERDSPPQWQPLLNGHYGQVFTQDLKMAYFPVKWDVGEGLDNDLASSSVFVAVHETVGRMHYDWNRSWLFTTYNFDAAGDGTAETYTAWRTTYGPWGAGAPLGLTSLHKEAGVHAPTKVIEDIVYQRGFPGFDVFAINTSDNLLHAWRRGRNGTRNGTGGAAVETEAEIKVNAVSAVYARSFDKVFVTAIEKEGSSHPILFKALTGHHEAVDDGNKLSQVSEWEKIPGQFVLLDVEDTSQGVVGIAYDVAKGLKFLVCDSAIHCIAVGVEP